MSKELAKPTGKFRLIEKWQGRTKDAQLFARRKFWLEYWALISEIRDFKDKSYDYNKLVRSKETEGVDPDIVGAIEVINNDTALRLETDNFASYVIEFKDKNWEKYVNLRQYSETATGHFPRRGIAVVLAGFAAYVTLLLNDLPTIAFWEMGASFLYAVMSGLKGIIFNFKNRRLYNEWKLVGTLANIASEAKEYLPSTIRKIYRGSLEELQDLNR